MLNVLNYFSTKVRLSWGYRQPNNFYLKETMTTQSIELYLIIGLDHTLRGKRFKVEFGKGF